MFLLGFQLADQRSHEIPGEESAGPLTPTIVRLGREMVDGK